MWANVKKIVLSLSVIVLFALYALQKQSQPAAEASIIAASLPATTITGDQPTATFVPVFARTTPTPTAPAALQKAPTVPGHARATSTVTPTASAALPTVTASRMPVRASAVTATAGGAYRDGSYTGIQADAHWGTVEVLAVIANGQTQRRAVYGLPQPSQSLAGDQSAGDADSHAGGDSVSTG